LIGLKPKQRQLRVRHVYVNNQQLGEGSHGTLELTISTTTNPLALFSPVVHTPEEAAKWKCSGSKLEI
jgi:hypothetical protein